MNGSARKAWCRTNDILDRALPMLETMIRRDKNHPCCHHLEHGQRVEDGQRGWDQGHARPDPPDKGARPDAAGHLRDSTGLGPRARAYEDADLVATNMYFGSLDGADRRPSYISSKSERGGHRRHICAARLTAFPDKPLVITEFGAVGIPGMHGDVASTEDFQADYIRTVWAAISAVPEVSGGVLWSWADYYHRRHFQANGAVRGLRRGHDRPQAQGGAQGPRRDVRAAFKE